MSTTIANTRELGAAIRQARRDRGLTQEELAERIGASRRWLIALEGGERRGFDLSMLLDLVDALGLTLSLDTPRKPSDIEARLGASLAHSRSQSVERRRKG